MDWLSDPLNFFIILGIVLIVFEVAVMQLATFWLFYIGLGALLTALVIWLFPELQWWSSTAVFITTTLLITLSINKPLRKWQNKPSELAGNDAIGQKVEVLQRVSADKPGKVSWSGSDWHAELAAGGETCEEGARATIVSMHGITLVIK